MGVNGLWALLKPYRRWTTLADLARTRFEKGEEGKRQLKIGIDASIWLIAAEKQAEAEDLGDAEALEILLHMTTDLLSLPLLAVFVFDGCLRPSVKRGRPVSGRTFPLENQFRELVRACGFEEWKARGEAEVELAGMAEAGLIDLVLSDDGDTLVFGNVPVLRNQLFNNGAPFASLAVDFVTVKHPMYEPSALQASFDHPTRIFVALFAGGDYGHGVFPKSPQSSGVLTDFDGRSQIAASVGKEPLAADNPTGPTIASAFVTSLRRVIGASTSDQAHLIDQERSDWLPIFERAVSPLVENMADVDLEALFDLRIIKLYLRPETCSDAELLRFRPQWAMRPSVTQIATFIDKYLANSSLSEAKANRASRRRQEIATGLVANQLRHEALKDDPWTRPSSFRSTKLPALAARRTGALKALQIILDAGPIAAVLHGLDDSATSHIMVVELDALFAPSLPQHLFEPGLWSNIFRQTTEEHRAGSWEPPKRGKVMRDRKAKRTLSTESRLLEGQQVLSFAAVRPKPKTRHNRPLTGLTPASPIVLE